MVKTCLIAEQFFPYDPHAPGAPPSILWKINGDKRPPIGKGIGDVKGHIESVIEKIKMSSAHRHPTDKNKLSCR